MNHNLRIGITILGLVMFVAGAIIGVYGVLNSETVETKCYDNHNNEIKGLVCEGEEVKNIFWLIFLTMGGMTAILIGILENENNQM